MDEALCIYDDLPNRTDAQNIIITEVYGKGGVKYAKTIGAVFSLRLSYTEKHFGNPFSPVDKLVKRDNLIKVESTKEAVVSYINWILTSDEPRAEWIRSVLKSGIIRNKMIIYYKELGEPSHANALDYLINKYNWKNE